MTTLTIVESLDIIKHAAPSVRMRIEHLDAYFSLERGEKAFHHGVVPAVTLAAHTWLDISFGK